ncbi:centriole and centriolar satellite protein ofd1 isoform X3 [Gadus morhua]|uniref:centriole and centriolar satellite protein ofd1 isoform X3 n=1 Tax=Gadus morhua TaxID=8049 RepID=UPI0011B82751|nr:oral-facial-digital syndrome 1 protein isoform X3 [Gadus morhua]
MSAAREDLLSPDELRKRLYQTFKSKGVLDTLKTQLRNQLIQELKHPLLGGGDSVPGSVSPRPDSLLLSASNTIVADYLKTSGHEYTLSVFYPESGLRKDKILSTKDLLQFMKISHHSPLYKSLTSNEAEAGTGFLTSLLTHLADPRGDRSCSDANTQTASAGGHRESLVDKMKMIDQEYEGLHHRGDRGTSCESKLAAYKRELDSQMHAEMNLKMQHFKDVELARVKMDEQTRSQKEFAKFRQDVERTYEMKANALMNREKNAIDRLQKQQEMDENNVYMQRQTLLKEIEKVRNRENDLKLRTEGFEKTCEMHADKVKALEDLLRRRELAVRTSEETYDQKLHNEVSRYKSELKEEFSQRTEQLTENENRNKVETARIQKETAALDAKTDEHLEACAELRRVQGALEASQQQASLLGQQGELLRERLEAVGDHAALKREKAELQEELRRLRRQLEEAQEESQLLRSAAARPSEEQLALQKEVQRLHADRRQEQEESGRQRQVLQAQLQGEAERCALLQAQLMESEEKSHWLNTNAEEMKLQVRQTQQGVMAFPELSPQGGLSPRGRLSPAPLGDRTPPSDGGFSPDLSPPHAPQLQSTARDHTSPPRPPQPLSSSESSPRPEEIHLEDLSTTLPEPGSIPELLLDTAGPRPPREGPGGAVPPPETPVPQGGHGDAGPGETAAEEHEEERERRERKERRQREQEEAKLREQEELSRLERETTPLEVRNAERSYGEDEREEKEEAVGGKKSEEEEQQQEEGKEEDGSRGGVTRSPAEDPLQKYMKMVLEARGAKRAQSPTGAGSPDARSLSEARDDSIAAFSHEAVDDDFW